VHNSIHSKNRPRIRTRLNSVCAKRRRILAKIRFPQLSQFPRTESVPLAEDESLTESVSLPESDSESDSFQIESQFHSGDDTITQVIDETFT